jgi:hypothetical protein
MLASLYKGKRTILFRASCRFGRVENLVLSQKWTSCASESTRQSSTSRRSAWAGFMKESLIIAPRSRTKAVERHQTLTQAKVIIVIGINVKPISSMLSFHEDFECEGFNDDKACWVHCSQRYGPISSKDFWNLQIFVTLLPFVFFQSFTRSV